MGGWNTDSGASLHGELIGREWVKQGHQLAVLTFKDYAFHGTQITGEDEEYVNRCFTVKGYSPEEFDPIPFLTANYEIFVIEDLGMLPLNSLRKIYNRIKKKSSVVNIIHDGKLSSEPSFYQFDWDAIVCFDSRYREFLTRVYDPEKIHIIPYPCHPLMNINREKARKKLNLPLDRKIIFGFGPASEKILTDIDVIFGLAREYPILLLITTKSKKIIEKYRELKGKGPLKIEVREEAPDNKGLYDYLHAADLLLLNKKAPLWVVISSTIYQCLGSGCPIVARDSGFVEDLDREVIKFSDRKELKSSIRSVFEKDKIYKETIKSASLYVKKNSASQIAYRYIELFKSLKNLEGKC